MNLRDSVLIQPDSIGVADVRALVSFVGAARRKDSLVSNFNSDTGDDTVEWVVDKTLRDTQEVQLSEPIRRLTHGIVDASVRKVIASFYAVAVRDWEPAQILSYGVGGHYIPHVDAETLYKDDIGLDMWEKTLDRDLSLVYFLNDDFEGGDLIFPDLNLSIKPQAGTLVCFPSDHNFVHGVNPVTSGRRYTLVTWLRVAGMPSIDEINDMNMEEYERMWPTQIDQPPRVVKGGAKVR